MENQSIPLYDSDTVTIEQNPLDNSITLHSKEKYKTDEKVIGTWIDDKPIYRKVITQNFDLSSNEQLTVNLNTLNVKTFINARIIMDTENFTSIDHSAASTGNFVEKWFFRKNSDNNTVMIYTSVAMKGTCYIILEYTKTTD